MTEYIADEQHFKEVIARVPNVRRQLWIGTADIKDLYVGERLIHAKEPGPGCRSMPTTGTTAGT